MNHPRYRGVCVLANFSELGIGNEYQQVIKRLVLLAPLFVHVYNKRKA